MSSKPSTSCIAILILLGALVIGLYSAVCHSEGSMKEEMQCRKDLEQ